MRKRNLLHAALISLLTASVALSGCAGLGGEKQERGGSGNDDPEAKFEVNRDSGWNRDEFVFDARKSSDPDGNIDRWRFDFGDGSSAEGTREDDAELSHAYLRGGEYTVTLTVTDDGGENAGPLTDTDSVRISVNEEQQIAAQVLHAAPACATAASKFSHPFNVTEEADKVDVSIDLRSTVPVGSSEVTFRFVDPDGDTLKEERFSIGEGATKTAQLSTELSEGGIHHFEIEATSGGVTAEGELRIYYDESEEDR